jgi:aromatic ring hydroxylase
MQPPCQFSAGGVQTTPTRATLAKDPQNGRLPPSRQQLAKKRRQSEGLTLRQRVQIFRVIWTGSRLGLAAQLLTFKKIAIVSALQGRV